MHQYIIEDQGFYLWAFVKGRDHLLRKKEKP